jgi:uncharacterized protein YneF (UPF0154 family)
MVDTVLQAVIIWILVSIPVGCMIGAWLEQR